ncbi:RHS repeat-associated core domain-containing protein [Paraglaciecola aquimarina]|uniref:RHS repeat-associated core domain-containing protein n=1 Tax=Paraglaciecola aquimarina TaxID=1235557 RepID=A0ABU3SSJ6_9ALTE|nr:RHS repeat-associated core domain-containing protein [Paraglaciecola aquimarina]MDU0352996.1 RHS repeat-associated core domain-containing protein [Paraglaciecola aquimarina]
MYDKNSRLAMLTAGNVVTAYEYNSENMIEKETLSLDGESFVLDYIYNSTGNLTNTIYPSGTNIGYAPNALGQAKQVGSYATNALYHANGMVKSHSYGNGFAHTSTQKTSGLPNTFYDKRSSTYALNHGFTYDANNNVTFLDDKVNNAYDLRLTFDGLDRLNNITDSYLGTGDVNYDTLGNITYYKLGNQTIHYYYNSNKQLDYTSGSKSYNFSYDDKGNVTDNGTRSFGYNTANQMVDSDGYLYTYDGNNKRVKEHGSNGLSYSFYASNGKLMYRKANNQHIDYYYLGGKLVANKKASTVTYLHSDYLGSTAAESNSAGTVTDRMHYQPFGESIETPKDDVGYTGHKFDTDLGLSYMQARYYDPVIGRFYSNDPVGYIGTVDSFNRYSYVANNPYRYTDPTGMSKLEERDDKNYQNCEDDPNCYNVIQRSSSKSASEHDPDSGVYEFSLPSNLATSVSEVMNVSVSDINGVELYANSKWANFLNWLNGLRGWRVDATTLTNAIYLPSHVSPKSFMNNHNLLLHEYFHVIKQWNTGRMGIGSYLLSPDKWENEAKNFARKNQNKITGN